MHCQNTNQNEVVQQYQLQRPVKGKRLRAIVGVEKSLQKLGIKETFTSIWRDQNNGEDIIVHFCADSEFDQMRLKSLLASHTTQAPFKCVLIKKFPRCPDGSINLLKLPPPPTSNRGRDKQRGRTNLSAPISSSPPPPPVSPIQIDDNQDNQFKKKQNLQNIQHRSTQVEETGHTNSNWASPNTQIGKLMKSKYGITGSGSGSNRDMEFNNNANFMNRPNTAGTIEHHLGNSNLPSLSPMSSDNGGGVISAFHRRRSSQNSGSHNHTSENDSDQDLSASWNSRNSHFQQMKASNSNLVRVGTAPSAPTSGQPNPNNPRNAHHRHRGGSSGVGGDGGGGSFPVVTSTSISKPSSKHVDSGDHQGLVGLKSSGAVEKDDGRYKRWIVDAWTEQGPHHGNEDRWCCVDDLYSVHQDQGMNNLAKIDSGGYRNHSKKSSLLLNSSNSVKHHHLQLQHQPKNGLQSESKPRMIKLIKKVPSGPSTNSSSSISSNTSQCSAHSLNLIESHKISFWACFDGHGGKTAAEFCRANAAGHVIDALGIFYGKDFAPTTKQQIPSISNNNGTNNVQTIDNLGHISATEGGENDDDDGNDGQILIDVLEHAIGSLEDGFKRVATDDSGCCATLVLCKRGIIATANLGDCQAMLFDSKIMNKIGGKATCQSPDRGGGGDNPNNYMLKNAGRKNSFGKSSNRYKVNNGSLQDENDFLDGGSSPIDRNRQRRRSSGGGGNLRNSLDAYQNKKDSPEEVISYELTTPHRASDPLEVARILACGGTVINGRVMGVLEPSRAIGDLDLKKIVRAKLAVSIIPALAAVTLFRPPVLPNTHKGTDETETAIGYECGGGGGGVYGKARSSFVPTRFEKLPDHPSFLVLASDGLWDFLSVTSIGAVVREAHRGHGQHGGRISVARKLVEEAKAAGSEDDITVLVVTFIA